MNYQPEAEDRIVELILTYIDLRSSPDQQDKALDRLIDSIFRMQVRYISKLVLSNAESQLDIQLLANNITYEFLDRYLIGQHRSLNIGEHVLPLLKKIARSRVINAIRDSRRECRHPDRSQADGVRFIHFESMAAVEDTRSGGQPSDPLAFNELVGELESELSEPILRAVYRFVIDGFSASDIAAKLNWDKRTAERLLAEVRKELRPWCESNLSLCKEPRTKNQEPRTKNQEPRTKNQEPRNEGRGARNFRRENREIDSVIRGGNSAPG